MIETADEITITNTKRNLLRRGLSRGFVSLVLIGSLEIAGFAHPGWGLIVDRNLNIFFGDVETNTIWKLNRERRLEALVNGKHSHSLYLDPGGELIGEHVYYDQTGDRWISSIWRLSPEGQLTDLVAPTSNLPMGSGVFMDDARNIYSVQGGASTSEKVELVKRSPNGAVSVIAGGARGHADGEGAEAKFNYIVGMAWGPEGSLYVTDGTCIRKISSDGFVTTIGGDPLAGVRRGENPRLLGLTVDHRGNIFVADYEYRCVRQISHDGTVNSVLNESFLWSPSGVTSVGDDLYILEHQPESVVGVLGALGIGPYARVRKVSADGAVSTIVTLWGKNSAIGIIGCLALGLLVLWAVHRRRRTRRGSLAA